MEATVLYSVEDDPELRDWIIYQSEGKDDFIRSLAQLALKADLAKYAILRPTLLALHSLHPEPNSTKILNTDNCYIKFNDVEPIEDIVCVFNRFNAALFSNAIEETKIRWATSIRNNKAPGSAVGFLALPSDPISHPVPDQFRITKPYIFITERLKGVKPLDEYVLLHEMCHFKAHHHGPEFLQELKRALDQNHWHVLLGGY